MGGKVVEGVFWLCGCLCFLVFGVIVGFVCWCFFGGLLDYIWLSYIWKVYYVVDVLGLVGGVVDFFCWVG